MRRKLLDTLSLVVLVMTLSACGLFRRSPSPPLDPITPTPVVAAQSRAIVLGDISDDPGEVIEGTQPLADYLAAQLADFGITGGEVRVVATADEMTELLRAGDVDLYCDSVYPATLISDASGATPILRRWRYGVEAYYTVIFASAESGIASLEDLEGRMIALDNAFSTSGYLLPVVTLVDHGLKPVGKAASEDAVAADEVGFVFSYDDENTLQWVLSGLVEAGATDDYHFNVAFPEDAREKLVKLAETESVPRQVVVARPGLDPALLEAIKATLMAAHESEAGQAALDPFQTSRFDEFPGGIEAAQQRMREMMDIAGDVPMP